MRPWTRDPDYLARYAAATADLKNLTDETDRLAVYDAITTAFNNVYKAVAFDIDGTLTMPSGSATAIDPEMARVIVDLLSRGVSVYLITGRGRGGARTAANALLRAATESDRPAHLIGRSLRRLHAMSNNGAFLLSTVDYDSKDFNRTFLREETTLVSPGPVADWHNAIRRHLGEQQVSGWTMQEQAEPAAVRIECENAGQQEVLLNLVRGWVEAQNVDGLRVVAATYSLRHMLEVGTVRKGDAVQHCAALLGVKDAEVLRIGDHGETDGNDHDLLNSVAGFSVDKVSTDSGTCHPVLAGPNWNQLIGAAATQHLLRQLYLFPPLSVSNVDYAAYQARFAEFEHLATQRSRVESSMIERQITVRLRQLFADDDASATGSIAPSDLFDDRSGAVRLTNWEFEQLRHDAGIWNLFDLGSVERTREEDHGSRWAMFSDTSILLRGPHYYRAESQKRQRNPDLIGPYIADIREFINSARPVLADMRSPSAPEPDLLLVKVLAGILDNVRNAILQLTHVALQLTEPHAAPEQRDRDLVTQMGSTMLLPHTERHIELLFDANIPWHTTVSNYESTLADVDTMLTALATDLPNRYAERAAKASDWYAEFYKGGEAFKWREADHILQNVAAIQMGLRRLVPPGQHDKLPWAVGLTYGGLELPAIAYVLGTRAGRPVMPAVAHISLYNDEKASADVRAGSDIYISAVLKTRGPVLPLTGDVPDSEDGVEFEGRTAIILDDNNTTGRTLQLARDLLVYRGADVLGAIIIRFPGANRTKHMAMVDHGYFDLNVAFSFVWGFVASSPYTRLVVPGQMGKGTEYEDENGVFDKAKQRIRYLLRKNDPTAFPDGVTPPPRDLPARPESSDASPTSP